MFTRDYRPVTYDMMAGQELNKRILKSIVANPEQSPKSLIFYGAFGSGKTTSARLLARALNCSSSHKPCGKCEICTCDLDMSPIYSEYDSSVIGNVDKIRELRDTFYYSSPNAWRVVVIDECHLVSTQAQAALLKVIEEAPARVFFVFATTDIHKVLRTIRSRSLELRFDVVSSKEVVDNLQYVASQEGKELPDDVADIIAKRSRGHMRNAHMLLEKFFMIGPEDFMKSVSTSHNAIFKYFVSIGKKDKNLCFQAIDEMLMYPLADVTQDYQEVVADLARAMVGDTEGREEYFKLAKLLGSDLLRVVKGSIADWLITSFDSDVTLRTALLCFFQMFNQQTKVASNTVMARAVRR